MAELTRRTFAAASLQTLLVASLFQHSARAQALAGTLKWSVRPWLRRLDEVSAALSSGALAPRGWQREVEDTLGRVDMADFLRSLDFERLSAGARFPQQGEGMERLYFLEEGGRLQALKFRPFLFTLARGTAVVPHGHHNMATMHMVLDGRALVRHFDKLESTATHMLIKPASEAVGGPGEVTSISDDHHNVHWFEALSDRVFMFNIAVYQLRPGSFGDRDYVDPLGAEPAGEGAVRAARLDRDAAYAKYGRT
jgi:hypothetical protein